ncbi:MAG: LysM peptidoglycan-binding domain-containing protein [Bacteroidota bacterium]
MATDNKLTITGYAKKKKGKPVEKGSFKVLINPESFQRETEIKYNKRQPLGSPGANLRFMQIPAERVSFKLIFDGTGLITTGPTNLYEGKKIKTVKEQINAFKAIATDYQGKVHEPYYLKLTWGDFSFTGVLIKLNVTYKLFKSDGTALRAEADVTFSSSLPKKKQETDKKTSSPDMTHVETVRAGDRLPALCDAIYESPNYFIQVAKSNNLNHFRRIKPGKELLFPPIKNK